MNETSVIIATLGLLGSVLTASLSYYFTKKHQFKMEERRLKEEFYKMYVKALSKVANDNKDPIAENELVNAYNQLLLIGNPEVIQKLIGYHDLIRRDVESIPRNSQAWLEQHDKLLTEMINAMRTDLFSARMDIPSTIHLIRGRKMK